ncbi:MAG: signal peptidase I, partial [Marinilabiliales bacterium]
MGGRKRKREIKDWIKALIIALVILLLCKAFIIDIHVVQNTYMNSTLRQGDYVLVNKLKHGARFPITPLSLPFSNKYLDWLKLPYFRLPGFADIERGELLAINYPKISDLPIDRKEVYVKRCVALPADTLNI